MTTAFIPIRHCAPNCAPWMTAPWPTCAPGSRRRWFPGNMWTTAIFLDIAAIGQFQSCPNRHARTAPAPMKQSAPMVTCPMTTACGCTKAEGCTTGTMSFEGLDHAALGFSRMVAYPWPTPMQRVTRGIFAAASMELTCSGQQQPAPRSCPRDVRWQWHRPVG